MPALFPETAKALETNRSGALRATVIQALRNTDQRIAEDRPVTPAFLFAALLWPAYCRELAVLQKKGVDPLVAQQRAADRVTLHQAERIALPRRFSLPMQEIWLLQPRFAQRLRKRVFRLLAHPRFRAAFDFLELRMSGNPEIAEDVAFWREAQVQSPEHLAETLERKGSSAGRGHEADEVRQAPRKRRRRRSPGACAARGPCRNERRADPQRFVGLGGNVGDVEDTLMEALLAIDGLPQTSIRAQSRFYRSPPGDVPTRPDFINAVVEVRTRLAPASCWINLLEIENAARPRPQRGRKMGSARRSISTCWCSATRPRPARPAFAASAPA